MLYVSNNMSEMTQLGDGIGNQPKYCTDSSLYGSKNNGLTEPWKLEISFEQPTHISNTDVQVE